MSENDQPNILLRVFFRATLCNSLVNKSLSVPIYRRTIVPSYHRTVVPLHHSTFHSDNKTIATDAIISPVSKIPPGTTP